MKNTDVELIQRVLDGDDTAFAALVKKYQKPVHALAWRKVEDFHVAEEITQDTFLKAYQNLAMLKEPERFASWLYVIAANHCRTWLRKKRLRTRPFEDIDMVPLGQGTYSGYVVEENERVLAETQREVVKKLLAKLPESERTVITLHYFGEMSNSEIGEFLGVSVNTIKSRLHRAQQRLKREEYMIREALDGFQIAPHLMENIMREVSLIKPVSSTGGKPLVPWTITVSIAAAVFLMLGIGNQYLARFQKPYSLDAAAERTVELIEASVVLNLESKPDVKNQLGNIDAGGEGGGTHQKTDAALFSLASGHVVDEAGNPVMGLPITLVSVFDGNGAWFPVHEDQDGSPIDPPTFRSETDAQGRFAITDVIAGPVLFMLPFENAAFQLLKVQIGGLFFYATGIGDRGIVFDVGQRDYIENIEVTVQSPHIRGKVERVNGTPIVDERVKLRVRTFSPNGRSSSSSSTHTDTEGYFRYYVNSGVEEPTFYTLSITCQGQTVTANPIVLKAGDPTHDIVFTFDGPAPPLPAQVKNFFSASASASIGGPGAVDVWVIRPENWHAYKMIKRQRWRSAQAQAAAEGAYLVAINDASEQNWLQAVFGNEPTWIGLNDIAKEGQWQWDSGEPLTYTNWRAQKPHDLPDGDEDYVIMGPSGEWENVNPRNRRWFFIQTAIIEKEEPPLEK